jgi:hypothetical protein
MHIHAFFLRGVGEFETNSWNVKRRLLGDMRSLSEVIKPRLLISFSFYVFAGRKRWRLLED